MNLGRKRLLQIVPVLRVVFVVLRRGVFAEGFARERPGQGVLLVASYVLYLTWEPWFCGGFLVVFALRPRS